MTADLRSGSGTSCVHAGRDLELPGAAAVAPLVPPLVQSTTYAWSDLDHPPELTYARGGNPTVRRLETALATLEGGASAVAFGSGLAAIDALLRTVPVRGRIVLGRHLYGGTTRLVQHFGRGQWEVETVDTTDAGALARSLERPAALVFVESPSNPTLQITDLRAAARAAHGAGALLAVDNTLLTPLYQRPIGLGADVVVHSTTKYLDGHDATLGGAVVLGPALSGAGDRADGPLEARLRFVRKATGAVLAPFEAWLTLQGLKTLHLRTAVQWASARRLADTLRDHPAARTVHYPGLGEDPARQVHRSQASGNGGIVAVDLGSYAAARAFASALRVFTLAENLGATESLVTHPASMTHADLPAERRREDGIPDGLVRLSVGVEDIEDLERDVRFALAQIPHPLVPTP